MAIFEVLNVGQGDSIIMRPPMGCKHNDETIFVDLGPGNNDITKYVADDEKVHIFLTHHDNDHVGGLRFLMSRIKQIHEITVPLYQNEITLIARAILNLKGIVSSNDCNEFIKALEEIVNNQVVIKSLVEGKACPKLSFAYEDKYFCNHIECLNPPVHIESYDWVGEVDKDDLTRIMYEVFTKPFAREMELYIHAHSRDHMVVDSQTFNEFWLYEVSENERTGRVKCNYVLNFILSNIVFFETFNEKSTREHLRKIYNQYIKCTHDVCMVLKTAFDNEKMLLTGDASKKVFNRLIEKGKDISASYLKMPHHGSKHNMNGKILDKINPKVAIISHKNGRFGTAKDTHPNQEILELLLNKNIKILITNDVIKCMSSSNDTTIVMRKEKHCKDSYVTIY